jgi:hypothetical protein
VFGILVGKSADLTRAGEGAGVEEGVAVLTSLGDALHAAAAALSDVDPTETPD